MTAASARVTPDWLAMRRRADAAARDSGALPLAAALAAFLRARRPARPARLVDVGAGTGSGAAWLHERMPLPQRWRLIDHDPVLLGAAAPVAAGWAEPVTGDLDRLGHLLAQDPADAVTCQALLDLLNADDVRGLVAAATDTGAAVLAGLTVTGAVALAPEHPDDALVATAFNAHQRRGGRLGPDAAAFAASLLQDAGYAVTTAATPWRLGPADAPLLGAWLDGRAAAAVAQDPAAAARIGRWHVTRRRQAERAELSSTVAHVDVLGVPAP